MKMLDGKPNILVLGERAGWVPASVPLWVPALVRLWESSLVGASATWSDAHSDASSAGQSVRRLIIQSVEAGPACGGVVPGEVVVGEGIEGLVVGCGDGTVRVLRLQPEGRRSMDSTAFLRGNERLEGARVGPFSGSQDG